MIAMKSLSICIVGPTAVGKTGVAVEIAKLLNGEVIGLDSRQIYRHLAIGTAQPTEKEQQGVPHHLYGIREPGDPISAGEYAHLVKEKIDEIEARGNLPIICGGSGLYFRALTKGIFNESTTDMHLREKLTKRLAKEGAEVLLAELEKVDPDYAEIVHPNNHKRLIRALEIFEMTGLPPTEHFRQQRENNPDDVQLFVAYLRPEMEWLDKRIVRRTDELFALGWIDEVKKLLEKGYSKSTHPMDSLGYGEIMNYLEGKFDFDEIVAQINLKSRHYAKKQISWFNKERVNYVLQISTDEDSSKIPGYIEKMYHQTHV